MQAYLGDASVPYGSGEPAWEAYSNKDHNSAVQAGLSPLQNWVYAPHVFSPLDPLLTPRMAVGLALDWADLPKLLVDMVVKDLVPYEERQAAIREMRAKLEGWVADGSITNPMLGYWSLLMAAFDVERQCDGVLEGLPLLQDAVAFCGCAVVCDWAFRGDRAMPQISSLMGGFLGIIAERVEALGRDACQPGESLAGQGLETAQAAATAAATTTAAGVGPGARDPTPSSTSGTAGVKTGNRQHGGKASGGASAGALASAAGSVCPSAATPAVPGDGTTVPGIRAASLAYALHVVTLALVRCDFPGWEAVWAGQLEASFRLVGMIGAPPGAQLPSWQVAALHILTGPLLLPLASQDPRLATRGQARVPVPPVELFNLVVGPAVMEGCVTMVTRLTGPYEALHQQGQLGTLSTYTLLGEHLYYSASGICKCLLRRHMAEEFLHAGGIRALLGFLSRYAMLQRGLTWRHRAHDIAAECVAALNTLPHQSLPPPESRGLQPGPQAVGQLLFKAGVSRVLLEVLRNFPPLADVAKYVSQDQLADPMRESPHVRMLLSMLPVLKLVCQASIAAKRELALDLDGLKVLVQKGTHWEPGVPLGTPEGKRLAARTPGAPRMFRLWAQLPLALIADLLRETPSANEDGSPGDPGESLSSAACDRLRQLMSPAELLGLLRWHDSEAKQGFNFPVEIPGISKVLAADQHFREYLVEECCKPFEAPNDPIDDLQRRTWAATLLHDMLWHLSRAQGRSPDSGRQLVRCLMLEGGFLHAALCLLQGALAGARDLDKYLEERLGMLQGSARRGLRREHEVFGEKGMHWYCQPANAASKLLDMLLQDPPLVREACQYFVIHRDDTPELGPPFHRLCAGMQRSRDKGLQAVAASTAAALRRIEALAKEAQQEEADTEAAARDAAAAALVAEEEAAQQAQQAKQAKASKRQRQKAAKLAQQAQERADREERERRQKAEEEQQRQAEEQEREETKEWQARQAEGRQRRQVEERQLKQAAQQQGALKPATPGRAGELGATKGSKRQRKKATQQAQHAHAEQATANADVHPGTSPADPGDACAEPAPPAQQLPAASLCEALAAPLNDQQPALASGGDPHGSNGAPAVLAEEQQPARIPGGDRREPAAAVAEEQDPELQDLLSMLFPAMQPPSPADAQLATGTAQQPQQEVHMPGEATNRVRGTATSASSSGAECTVWVALDDSSATESSPTKLPPARLARPPSMAAVVRCRLSGKALRDPVVAADGWTYERSALETYLAGGGTTSPVTGQPLGSTLLRPNFAMRDLLAAGGLTA
ncbi:hypothetical protein N2152v2_006708 [Parachlorella kessleri]